MKTLTLKERINTKSQPNTVTGCIHWLGAHSPNGYGNIHLPKRGTALVHRVVWILHNGPIPSGLVIEHTCCNKDCVNIDHLKLSTQKHNVNHPITVARRRSASRRRGKNLSELQLKEIHGHLDQGLTGYAISKLTGRSESHIAVIKRKYLQQKRHAYIEGLIEFMLSVPNTLPVAA